MLINLIRDTNEHVYNTDTSRNISQVVIVRRNMTRIAQIVPFIHAAASKDVNQHRRNQKIDATAGADMGGRGE